MLVMCRVKVLCMYVMSSRRVRYHKLESTDQIELLTVSMEEGVEVQFSGEKPLQDSRTPSGNFSSDGGEAEEGFISVPVSQC